MTTKPSRKGLAWLPLATHAVAAGLNSPTAKQILAQAGKPAGSQINGHSVSWSMSCPDAAAYYPLAGPSGGDSSYLDKERLPSERVSKVGESLPVHGPITVRESRASDPTLWHPPYAPKTFPYRSTPTEIAS